MYELKPLHGKKKKKKKASTLATESIKVSQSSDKLEEYVRSRGGSRVIRKVLIANNGMAATKAIISMRQWAYMELGDEKVEAEIKAH